MSCDYCIDPHPAEDCILADGTERILCSRDGLFGDCYIMERKVNFCPMCGDPSTQPERHQASSVPADELQAATDEAEGIKDSIVGGSNFAPYMYAYLYLRDNIEKMLESSRKTDAKMEREGG